MDLGSPNKWIEETKTEDGSSVAGNLDLNLFESKDEQVEESFGQGNKAMDGIMHVDSNEDQSGPPKLLVGANNEGLQSSIMNSHSPGPSPPLKKTEEHCLPIESDLYHNDVDRKISYYDSAGLRSPLDDYVTHIKSEGTEYVGLSDELRDSSAHGTFNNKMKTEDLDPSAHNQNANSPFNTYEVLDNEPFNHQNANSLFNETMNRDSGNLSGNIQSDKAEFVMEELDDGDRSHHTETKEDNGRTEWENSGRRSPQKTRIATPLPERQLSVSPERSPQTQPSARREERPSPVHSDRKAELSPSSSKRKRSLSPEKYNVGRKRAHSRDRLSPSVRRKSPSDSRTQRDSHHRDNSPRKRLSTSPRRRESPRRRGRSASRSPVRRRDSSGHRREQRGRSRSRSPYARDRHQRSPRRRHSPRRRSPPSGYHSRRRSPRRPGSPRSNRKNGVGRPGNNLFIAGFSYGTTERDLEKKFSKFGRVTDVRIVREKRTGDSRGFGFLTLEKDEDADAAIRALDQTEWNGRIVLVEKSKTSLR